jgi:uncharacterized protein DUF5076
MRLLTAVVLLISAFSSGVVAQKIASGALEPPPIAKSEPAAVEILAVWAAPGKPQQFTIRSTYKDPAAWGLLLVDIARHVSGAYAAERRDAESTLERIRTAFEAEWSHPTDVPQTIESR